MSWISVAASGDLGSTNRESDLVRETVERLSGATLRHYMTYDFGRARDARAVSVVVAQARAAKLVVQLREQLPDGLVAFSGTNRWLGDEDHGNNVEVVVAEIEDKYDILRLARTDAVNYGMTTNDLIAWFESHQEQIEVDIMQASTDMIFGKVLSGPEDMDSFVEELYEFCPDIVDQGSGNIADLREMLGERRVLFLWWD